MAEGGGQERVIRRGRWDYRSGFRAGGKKRYIELRGEFALGDNGSSWRGDVIEIHNRFVTLFFFDNFSSSFVFLCRKERV